MQYVCQNSNANSSKHTTSYQKAIKNEYPIHPHGIQSKYQVNTLCIPQQNKHSKSHRKTRNTCISHKKSVPLHAFSMGRSWKDGGVVDRGGLENR